MHTVSSFPVPVFESDVEGTSPIPDAVQIPDHIQFVQGDLVVEHDGLTYPKYAHLD